MFGKRRQRGFTLIELIVVIAIIGILVALILPAVQSAREAARRTQCQNNLKQIGVALHNYHSAHMTYPSGWIGATGEVADVNGLSGFGWATMILPMLDQAPLYESLVLELSLTDAANAAAREAMLNVFRCPSDIGPDRWQMNLASGMSNPDLPVQLPTANYVGSFGPEGVDGCEGNLPGEPCTGGGIFFLNSRVRAEHIADGESNTLMAGERKTDPDAGLHSTWVGVAAGGEENISRILGGQLHDFSSYHDGRAHMLFGDGRVRMILDTIDVGVFEALSTREGYEAVSQF